MPRKKSDPYKDLLIESLKIVVDGIAGTFGRRCEVVLHDLSNLDRSIVKIANGHVSGRSVGGSITDQGLKDPKKGDRDLILNYQSLTSDGRTLKSSTMIFRDQGGTPVAAICINLDIMDILTFNNMIQEMFSFTEPAHEEEGTETFERDVTSTLNNMASKIIGLREKQVQFLSKEERLGIVRELDNQGFFLIKGAIKILASKLTVSKFTIYNYLDQIRNDNEGVKKASPQKEKASNLVF